ncbi:MAG: hypothetical protein DBX53_07635 [Clostridiales bacterium]|nr:MAG: hypothetical protein DBX53_07635 [Clostridiales bacterium]
MWGILFPCHKINLQTGKSILHQFEGLHKLWDTPYYEAIEQILPDIKLYINTEEDGITKLLPIESFSGTSGTNQTAQPDAAGKE